MCFSANASFGAGVALAVIGVASIKQVQHKSQIVFACIPLFFSMQQISEGCVWLSLMPPVNTAMNTFTTYVFLTFAQVIWPLWIPIAMIMIENKGRRRKIQRVFVVVGIAESLYQAYNLLSYPVHSQIIGHHIYYGIDHPMTFKYLEPLFYITAVIVSPFFTSIKKMWVVGTAILISCLITVIFYEHYTISVWCFFASVISIAVFFIMRRIKNSQLRIEPIEVTSN